MRPDIDEWRRAGRIAREVLKVARSIIRPGMRIIDLCERLEDEIRRRGARPAFPVNIGINEDAAHYTSPPGDMSRIPNNSVVKVDIGAVLDSGAIADTAITIFLGSSRQMHRFVVVAIEILEHAIEHIRAGIRAGEIGGIIWRKAHELGYGVLRDLGGHNIKAWRLHAGVTIPNIPRRLTSMLKEGDIIAVEPFIVFGANDSSTSPDMSRIHIFSVIKTDNNAVLKALYKRFRGLPFAIRWLRAISVDIDRVGRLRKLLIGESYRGRIRAYPTLVERRGLPVAQFEHTLLVKQNSAEVLT